MPVEITDALTPFHPALASWFRRALGEPTPVQIQAWSAIRAGAHTLIAAPTGSGKTLAAFFTILNDLIQLAWNDKLARETSVLYISPLKALSNDIEKNLNQPLKDIQDEIFASHLKKIAVKVAVRTGDTPASERAAMIKSNPHILITTPESLFLLLTSRRGRDMLRRVKTVIVDEIHALVGEKRGAHLALSLERLQSLTGRPSDGPEAMVRIGLSATQKPIEEVARFLTGMGTEAGAVANSTLSPTVDAVPFRTCAIIDTGHRRKLDVQIEIPTSPLTAVMSNEVWDEVYSRIETLISEHTTTLLFVNTRRLAERVAHRLSQVLGEDKVAAHHGSLSKDRRFSAEQRLKSGHLKVLVATASLELGIDIGSVDLVIQIANPKSISSLLQRVGRSGHAVGGLPKGRLFPLTRDELIESASLVDALRRGELDTLVIPAQPLDILSQQIVAETASREWQGQELYKLVIRAYPYRNLKQEEFQEIVSMVAQGFTTRRGRRGAHLHHDAINDRLRARPGARLTALTNGGAIPDTFEYEVKLEPGNVLLGSVNEDFAIESMAGDIFQLGNNSWQILRIEGGTVRVSDAQGQPPSIPFWFGEAPGRTEAFSTAVSRLREQVSTLLGETAVLQQRVDAEGSDAGAPWKRDAHHWLTDLLGLSCEAAEQIVDYLAAAKLSLGVMPTRETLVLERFFDEAGDMHMILHSPFGNRINRAWGLALRKRFCRKFNFELQAAATEEGIILSLGATHSFPLDEVFQYLRSGSVRHILIQALLDAPMFEVRWRWNATRALALQRNRNGKKVPPQLQRMAAEDLVALVFPDQKACFENIQGEREVPDHPLVRQTISDCLHEAMNIEGLEQVLADIEAGRLQLEARDLNEPSPLSQEIINARPYAFLDDAPLEERRTRAIQSRRHLDPVKAGDLGRLDPLAIAAVRAEAWPQVNGPDDLHDALMLTGFLTDAEVEQGSNWRQYLETLMADNRTGALLVANDSSPPPIWVASERLAQAQAAFPKAVYFFQPVLPAGVGITASGTATPGMWTEEEALVELIRGRMESLGPVVQSDLANSLRVSEGRIEQALLALEQEGFILRGRFNTNAVAIEWCERRLLARIHRYTLSRLRREIEPVSTAEYQRFLFAWHGLDTTDPVMPHGPEAVEAILARLEGFEAPCAAWESEILPARLAHYEPGWLDLQGLSGNFIWARVRARIPTQNAEYRMSGPIKSTPIAFLGRDNVPIWLSETQRMENRDIPGIAGRILKHIDERGACFWKDILWDTGLTELEARDGIAELVSLGWLTSDGFRGLRSLLKSEKSVSGTRQNGLDKAGRWSLISLTSRAPVSGLDSNGLETFARILLNRYGVVFRKLADREKLMPPWWDLVRTLRTLEARGEIRGGRFVEGQNGEQFAMPEALALLRQVRKTPMSGKTIVLSAADPANLQGIITSSARIPGTHKNQILFRDGEAFANVMK